MKETQKQAYALHIHHGREVTGGGRGSMIKTDLADHLRMQDRLSLPWVPAQRLRVAERTTHSTQRQKHRYFTAAALNAESASAFASFPDDWTAVSMPNGKPVSNTQRYKDNTRQFNNAVPVMRWIGREFY